MFQQEGSRLLGGQHFVAGEVRFNFQGATDLAVGNPRRGSETTPPSGRQVTGGMAAWLFGSFVCFARQSLKG